MMSWLLKLLTGDVLSEITGVVDKYFDNQMTRAEMQAEIRKKLLEVHGTVAKHQAKIIRTELRGQDWLQRNWRALAGLSFVFVILFYVLLLPIAVDWFGLPPVRTGDVLLLRVVDIAAIAIAGYVGGEGLKFLAKRVL